jgi:cation diffusion facilitator CzcD-associated flavoprotein CzcO
LAHGLQRYGVTPVIYERGEIGESWAQMASGVRLHTRREAASLPGLALPRSADPFPSARDMHAYLQSYASHFQLQVRSRSEVRGVVSDEHGWQLDLMGREGVSWGERAELLIWAAGIWGAPTSPRLTNAQHFPGQLLHMRDYLGPETFAGQKVLVVGAGNSGKDMAIGLLRAGAEVALSLRDGAQVVAYPSALTQWSGELWRRLPRPWVDALLRRWRPDHRDVLPRPQRPASEVVAVVGLELIDALRRGELTLRPELADLSAVGAHFVDGRSEAFDAVLLATGFRPNTDLIDAHRGDPMLMVVGEAYPTLESFLQRLRREAPELAREAFERLNQTR